MSRLQVTWVVKLVNGQVKGPYSTEAILKMIGDGILVGQEKISKMPDGAWVTISKEPAFYDKLLEALEGITKEDQGLEFNTDDETIITPPELKQPEILIPFSKGEPIIKKIEFQNPDLDSQNITKPSKAQKPKSDRIIELSNIDRNHKKELIENLKIPLIILGAVIAIGLVILMGDDNQNLVRDKVHLLQPRKLNNSLSDQQVASKLSEALLEMGKDTHESYLEAQNKLVTLVEGAPNNLEVRALLCVVYKQIWPFAFQDAQDVKAMSTLTQDTRNINIVSPYGQVCEISKLITAGRFREAKGVTDSLLDSNDPFSLLSVVYAYKAELLEGEKDFLNAAPYFEKAVQLWDVWIYPLSSLGRIKYLQGNYQDSLSVYKSVLEKNSRHREGKLMMGLVLYRGFKRADEAFSYLSSGMAESSRIPAYVESEACLSLAEIYLNRGDKSKALNLAEKGYSLNPQNQDLKNLVVRLGGSDNLGAKEQRESDFIYVGDQYIRQGDFLAAQAEFKAAFEANPKNGTAAIKAAKALWQLNQSFEAIDWLNKAIKAEPKLITSYVLLADYLSLRFDFNSATQVLINATKVAPNNAEVLRGLALLEFRKNNMLGAINYALRSLKIYEGDIETYILLSKANSTLATSIVPANKKDLERKDNAAKDAIRYATKAVEIDSANTDAQVVYAKILAVSNGVDSGVTYLTEMIKRFSYTNEYRIALAELYKTEDRFNQAKEIYQKILDIDSKNKKAWLGLGECDHILGLNEKALKDFLKAAVLDPTDGEPLFQVGKIYLELGKNEDAIQQFKRVQRVNSNYPLTNYNIGRAAFASGDFNLALESAKTEMKINPGLTESYILSAEVFYARKQYGDCAAEYSKALKIRSQEADIYVKAAACYRQSGAYDVAEDMLTLALSRESGYAEIYREQGALYEIKGDARSAIQAYNKYLGLSPNAKDRIEIEDRVIRLGR